MMMIFQGQLLNWRALQKVVVALLFLRIVEFPFPGSSVVDLGQVFALKHTSVAGNHTAPTAPPALVLLGDSTVDAGVNTHLVTLVKCDWLPYGRDFPTKKPTGRFSNGKLIADFLAERLGLPYPLAYGDPNANGSALLHGINVASAGSGYHDLTALLMNVKTLPEQISWVKDWQKSVAKLVGNSTAASITSEAVFIISTGSNDWINNYFIDPLVRIVFNTTDKYETFLLQNVRESLQDLYDLGARRIGVASLPPLGCLPDTIVMHNNGHGQCIKSYNIVILAFNAGLKRLLEALQAKWPGSKLVYLDSYSPLRDAIINPAKYGITETNMTHTCCENGGGAPPTGPFCNRFSNACENASAFLFWDGFHTTQAFNRHVANIFYATMAPAMALPT